jgi:hypothetical protein
MALASGGISGISAVMLAMLHRASALLGVSGVALVGSVPVDLGCLLSCSHLSQ